MNPIPRPLYKKLVVTFFTGTGLFLIGLILSITGRDRTLFALSAAILICTLIRGFLFYRQLKTQSYQTLEGTCTELTVPPIGKTCRAVLTDHEGTAHTITLPKSYRISQGQTYRFYFHHFHDMTSKMPQILERSLSADNLLAVEQMEDPTPNVDEKGN